MQLLKQNIFTLGMQNERILQSNKLLSLAHALHSLMILKLIHAHYQLSRTSKLIRLTCYQLSSLWQLIMHNCNIFFKLIQ